MSFYDRKGNHIEHFEVARLIEDPSYRVVKQEDAPDGTYVSTVWLGIAHGFEGNKPRIFETMVFPIRGKWGEPLSCQRYCTEEEALKGHVAAMEERAKCVRKKLS